MADRIAVFEQEQNISVKEVAAFRIRIAEFLKQDADYFIINLEKVSYMNSAALGIIADTVIKVKEQNKKCILAGVQPTVEKVFRIVRFEKFVEYYPTYEAAVNTILSKEGRV